MPLRSIANGALFAESYGKGKPRVLALHGWARRGKDFSQTLTDIPALAVDLPGFGASPAPDGVIGADGYADIVAEILPEFDRPPVLVGHSFGGRVATCLAAKHTGSFKDLVLTGAPVVRLHARRKPAIGYRLMRALNQKGIISDSRMEAIRRTSGSVDYRNASGVMREILVKVVNESYEDQLKQVRCHVTLIWGSSDGEVPVSIAHAAADVISQSGDPDEQDAEVRVLEGIGHNVPVEAPDALRQVIVSLLDDER